MVLLNNNDDKKDHCCSGALPSVCREPQPQEADGRSALDARILGLEPLVLFIIQMDLVKVLLGYEAERTGAVLLDTRAAS